MSKTKQKSWFIKVRGSYLPNSWQAWGLYVPFVAYLVAVLMDISQRNLSAEHALYAAVPQFVSSGVIMTWLASKTSK